MGIPERFNFAHDSAADDGRVREPPDFANLFRSRDSESDCNGQAHLKTGIAGSGCSSGIFSFSRFDL